MRYLSLLIIALIFAGCSTKTTTYKSSSGSSTSSSNSKIIDTPNMHRATMRSYTINGKTYHPTIVSLNDTFSGIASWYGKDFHGKKTSNGEIYDMYAMTAAHKTLPMNTMVRVTNLKNNKSIVVRINDRGPFVETRIIDLSHTGASKIDMIKDGTAPVRLDIIGFSGVVGGNSLKSVEGGDFYVQIGAFRNESGAKRYASEYNGTYKTTVIEAHHDGAPMYRVFLTGFRSEDEARDFISSGVHKGAYIMRGVK